MSNLKLFDPVFGDNFDSAFRRFFSRAQIDSDLPQMKMRVDVTENDEGYAVKADIPGVKKEDISVRIDGNVVQIDAEVKRESESKDKGGKVLRSERYYGNISRSFSLADDVDEAKAEAKYAEGVLTLKLPKKTTAAARKVAVQ